MSEHRMITAWVGWVWFTAIVMVIMGAAGVIEGLVALFRDEFYVTTPERLLVFDLTGWGMVHLLLGALVALAGLALFSGAVWARVVAILVATLNAVAQLAFLPVYPLWSILVIALSVVAIWAAAVHGGEAARF